MSKDNVSIPDTNEIDLDNGAPQRKKIVTAYITGAVKAAKKMKKKYKRQRNRKIGQLNKQNKASADWLKQAEYLYTHDQPAINYNYLKIRNNNNKETKTDIGENIYQKKTSSGQIAAKKLVKKYRNLARKKPYKRPISAPTVDVTEEVSDNEDTINDIDNIATLQPGRNAQIVVKKISEKYKKMRSKKPKRAESPKIFKLPSDNDEIAEAVSAPRLSAQPAAKK